MRRKTTCARTNKGRAEDEAYHAIKTKGKSRGLTKPRAANKKINERSKTKPRIIKKRWQQHRRHETPIWWRWVASNLHDDQYADARKAICTAVEDNVLFCFSQVLLVSVCTMSSGHGALFFLTSGALAHERLYPPRPIGTFKVDWGTWRH